MPIASKVMIGYGALLVLGAIVGWTSADGAIRSAAGLGLATIAAGAAAAQGRTSLRKTGYFFGIFLPILCMGYYGWIALGQWRAGQTLGAMILSLLAVGGLLTVLIVMKLRAGDNIAERGYSVLPLTSHPVEPAPPPQPRQPVDRG